MQYRDDLNLTLFSKQVSQLNVLLFAAVWNRIDVSDLFDRSFKP